MAITNVAIAGGTGRMGKIIVQALLNSKQFNVTALVRNGSATSPGALPAGVKTCVVDYAKHDTLVSALTGQDAVVSTLSAENEGAQTALLDAAVAARVQRFIPSEYGSDVQDEHVQGLPVFAEKRAMELRLQQYAAAGKISYTLVISGPWLDLGLQWGFLGLDIKNRQLSFWDGGLTTFSTSTQSTVAKAVVKVLTKPEETKNRPVYVQDVAFTAKDLLRLAKQALGEDGWTEIDQGSAADLRKTSCEKFAAGEINMAVFVDMLQSVFFQKGDGGHFQKLDNELFGIPFKNESEIVDIIRENAEA